MLNRGPQNVLSLVTCFCWDHVPLDSKNDSETGDPPSLASLENELVRYHRPKSYIMAQLDDLTSAEKIGEASDTQNLEYAAPHVSKSDSLASADPNAIVEEEPELHARTYLAVLALFFLNFVQVYALTGPPAIVSTKRPHASVCVVGRLIYYLFTSLAPVYRNQSQWNGRTELDSECPCNGTGHRRPTRRRPGPKCTDSDLHTEELCLFIRSRLPPIHTKHERLYSS